MSLQESEMTSLNLRKTARPCWVTEMRYSEKLKEHIIPNTSRYTGAQGIDNELDEDFEKRLKTRPMYRNKRGWLQRQATLGPRLTYRNAQRYSSA